MRLTRLLHFSSVAFLCALNLGAQSGGWSSVKSIAPGEEVRVVVSGRGSIQGSLQSVTDDSVVLNAGSGPQTLGHRDVTRVSVKKKSHRRRNALIGLAAGAGVGAVVGVASKCTGFCLISTGQITAVTTVAGALLGTIVGVVIPTGGWQEIYKQ